MVEVVNLKSEKFDNISSSYTTSSSEADSEHGNNKSNYDIDRTNGATGWYAYFNLVCLTLGTGMLGLPSALKRGGWGCVAMIILAYFMASYTGIILQKCMYKGKTHRLGSYKEIGAAAFGRIGAWLSFFFTTSMIVGTAILYLVLAAANMNQMCAGTAGEIGNLAWTIIWCAVVGIPYIFLKSMNNVAWSSAFGAVSIIGTVLITIVLAGIDAPNQSDTHKDNIIWEGFPVSLATISYAAGSHIIYTNAESSLKNPKQWPFVTIGAQSTCQIMFLMLAISGYYIYGSDVDNPVYNSVPDVPARTVGIVLITINVIVSAPILLVPVVLDIEKMYNITVERYGKTKEFFIRAALRTAMMVFVAAVGILIPFFDLLMSLLGAFANSAVVFVLPVLFYWRLTGIRNKKIYELAWEALIVLFGLVAMIFGTWAAVEDLVDAFADGYDYRI